MSQSDAWRRYLAEFHATRPGITEAILQRALDGETDPYGWLGAALSDLEGPQLVLDVAAGSGPMAARAGGRRYVALDRSEAELGAARGHGIRTLACCDAAALPVADGVADVVMVSMALQIVQGLEVVLSELSRVLRPGGTLLVLLPSRGPLRPRELVAVVHLLLALGTHGLAYPNDSSWRHASSLLAGSGLVMRSDERRTFRFRPSRQDDSSLIVDSLYLPGLTRRQRHRGQRVVARWAKGDRSLPIPLRRIVASKALPPSNDLQGTR